MFKDKRSGWIKNLKTGDNVTVSIDGVDVVGKIKTITPIGVFLIECVDGMKLKVEPDGKDKNGATILVKGGKKVG